MTNEEINEKVARLMGWRNIRPNPLRETSNLYPPLCGTYSEKDTTEYGIPEYCNDLNACHEMEKALDEVELGVFRSRLGFICAEDFHEPYPKSRKHWSPDPAHATAKQRCLAFLKTKQP